LIVEQVATLKEVDKYYDLVDVIDAHYALDLRHAAEKDAIDNPGSGS